jgi:uncharacterized repeat protein (TIGR03803 family)
LRLAKPRFLRIVFAALAIFSFLNLTARGPAFGATEITLWNFGNGTDGSTPTAGLIRDANGNFYGTTAYGGAYGPGTVFELTPPSTAGGLWTESVLWSFGDDTDGAFPTAGLILDTRGNLYSTTAAGGTNGYGTVFELSPPTISGGNWGESILWNFGSVNNDGLQPLAGLIMDAGGNLYGTTSAGGTFLNSSSCDSVDNCGGTVFELSPPSTVGGSWAESTLWNFGNGTDGNNPEAGLIMDAGGNLYGTNTGGGGTYAENQYGNLYGTAFELSPPATIGGTWTESVLWRFASNADDGGGPVAGLIFDRNGNLYGTTRTGAAYGPLGGTVFELTPPTSIGGDWAQPILWDFGNGDDCSWLLSGLIMDSSGNLFGTAAEGGSYQNGALFKLTPPSTPGGSWTESIIWEFGGLAGSNPFAGLIMDSSNNLYGTTAAGGSFGDGMVFEITPNPTVLSSSSRLLNFGKVEAMKTSRPKKVTLRNRGGAAAVISGLTATAPFTIADETNFCSGSTVAPKKACSFEVEFAPITPGPVNDGSLNVTYNGTSPAIALKGNGTSKK